MIVTINGQTHTLENNETVQSFLDKQQISPNHVVVEVNNNIIQSNAYAKTVLKEKDAVEILRFVGGG